MQARESGTSVIFDSPDKRPISRSRPRPRADSVFESSDLDAGRTVSGTVVDLGTDPIDEQPWVLLITDSRRTHLVVGTTANLARVLRSASLRRGRDIGLAAVR